MEKTHGPVLSFLIRDLVHLTFRQVRSERAEAARECAAALALWSSDLSSFSLNTKNIENGSRKRKRSKRALGKGRQHATSKGAPKQSCDAKRQKLSSLCFFLQIIKCYYHKPKQRHPACCHRSLRAPFGGYLQAGSPDWNPTRSPRVSQLPSLLTPKKQAGHDP